MEMLPNTRALPIWPDANTDIALTKWILEVMP